MQKYRGKTAEGAEDRAVHVYGVQYDGSNVEAVLELFSPGCTGKVTGECLIIESPVGEVITRVSLGEHVLTSSVGSDRVYKKTHEELLHNYIPE